MRCWLETWWHPWSRCPGATFTNEPSDCLVPGLAYLQVVARAVVDHEVVPESQVLNLASVNLAMGHEVLQSAVSLEGVMHTLLWLIRRLRVFVVNLYRLLSRNWWRCNWWQDFFWNRSVELELLKRYLLQSTWRCRWLVTEPCCG